MATGRYLSQREARDPTLNSMTLAHILGFDRLVVAADDWGRASGDVGDWKSTVFPRQDHIDETMILAIQHDLATAGLVGFYCRDGSEYSLIFKFLVYQTIKSSHRREPSYPTPPESMWHLYAHPLGGMTRKKYDVPDMPYDRFCEVTAQNHDQRIFPPSAPRPPIEFVVDARNPFGGVAVGSVQPDPPRAEIKTQEGLFAGTNSSARPTDQEKELLRVIASAAGMKRHFDAAVALQKLREWRADYPAVDMAHTIKTWRDAKDSKPVKSNGRPWAEIRNWLNNGNRRSANSTARVAPVNHETGEMAWPEQ